TFSLIIREVLPVVFFFQAEDGIRGFHVTGVQTCAFRSSLSEADRAVLESHLITCSRCQMEVEEWRALFGLLASLPQIEPAADFRSEERRVGKEGRGRWAPSNHEANT